MSGGSYIGNSSHGIISSIDGGTIKNATLDSSVTFPAGGTGNPISVAIIADEKASGTSGGTFTSGDWRDRVLNTEVSDSDSIVSISSNQFTLASGTYFIEWACQAFEVGYNKTRLYDVTGATSLSIGLNAYAQPAGNDDAISSGSYLHTITSNNTYKIQHRCSSSATTIGFGIASSFGVVEVYTIVKILKLK